MPVYHIALFKLKSDADPIKVEQWKQEAHAMVGQVPGRCSGLLDLRADSPTEFTAPLAKGFDMAAVVLLDYLESLATFFTHPSHHK
ncbi:hypothetical protein APSETT444_004687 [Aspergillus pseudonomiae]